MRFLITLFLLFGLNNISYSEMGSWFKGRRAGAKTSKASRITRKTLREFSALVNKERSSRNLPKLKFNNSRCKSIATKQARSLARIGITSKARGYNPHKGWAKRSRGLARYASENVVWTGARHGVNPAHALRLLMNSKSHRAQILRRKNRSIAVGVARAKNGNHFWTQCFTGS